MFLTALLNCYLYQTTAAPFASLKIFNYYMAVFSVALFVVNLVPIITSDMALIVLAVSPGRLIS